MITCGLDIGTRNQSTAVYDSKSKKCWIRHTDLLNFQGNIIKPKESLLVRILTEYVEYNDPVFKNVNVFGIEAQKGSTWKGEKSVKRVKGYSKKTFSLMQHILHSILVTKYPSAEVYIIQPQSVRKFFGSSVKQTKDLQGDHKKRKLKSVSTGIKFISDVDVVEFQRVFKRDKKKAAKLDDVYDAIMLALYTFNNLNKLRSSKEKLEVVNTSTSEKHLSTTVNLIV